MHSLKGSAQTFHVENEAGKRRTIKKNPARWPGETGRDFVGSAGEVRRLPWQRNHPFSVPHPPNLGLFVIILSLTISRFVHCLAI